ncbi:MAG: hypothetical protein PHI34_01825 [Acidobacteriota bacterium]|nr:hypothetical protein [Acidobacteriota bacterium]
MSIGIRSRAVRTASSLAAVLLHVVFAVLAVMPPIVFCHRPDGRVGVEFSGPAGVCTCSECEACQARLAAARAGQRPAQEAMESCHCNHEPALTEAAGSSFRRDDGGPDVRLEIAAASSAPDGAGSLRAESAFAPLPPLAAAAPPGVAAVPRC